MPPTATGSLGQVLTQLQGVYQPQINSIQAQQAALPQQTQAQQQGLQAQQTDAFNSIVNNARARGTGVAFGGIPLQEQAQYNASTYMPALAKLQSDQITQGQTLQDALNKVYSDMYTQGVGIDQYNRDLAEKQREADQTNSLEQQKLDLARSSANSFSPTYGGSSSPTGGIGGVGNMTQRSDGGFNFTNQYGNPISAAAYAALNGVPFRDVLGVMQRSGDKGASQLLNFVGNDFKYDPTKLNSQGLANLYNSFVWGTPVKQASYNPQAVSNAEYNAMGGVARRPQAPAPANNAPKNSTAAFNHYGGSPTVLRRF